MIGDGFCYAMAGVEHSSMKKGCIILGTRPEIIKMSPVMRACERSGLDYFILHTGQHYSYNMDRAFFEQLRLPDAMYNLDVGSGMHGEQIGRMLAGIEMILMREKPDVILVEGDTNTVLVGALAASKLGIRVGHVEAGLRSYDRRMPKEINRVVADHISDYLYAPTERSRDILLGEGVSDANIFVTGNTVVDAVYQNLKIAAVGSLTPGGACSPRARVCVSVAFAAQGCCCLSEDASGSPLASADQQFFCRWPAVISPSGEDGEAPVPSGSGFACPSPLRRRVAVGSPKTRLGSIFFSIPAAVSGNAIESVSGGLQDLRAWSSIGWREAAPEGVG